MLSHCGHGICATANLSPVTTISYLESRGHTKFLEVFTPTLAIRTSTMSRSDFCFLFFSLSRWALTIHAFSAKIWHERKLFLLLFPSNSAALSRLPKSPAIQSSLFIFPDPHPHLFFPSYFALSVHHLPFLFCNIWGALPDRCKFSQKFINTNPSRRLASDRTREGTCG